MKAGIAKIRYIANRLHPLKTPGQWEPPASQLMRRLRYVKYRENTRENIAEQARYLKYRPDDHEKQAQDAPLTTRQNPKHARRGRSFIDRGMGSNPTEIGANCERFASARFLALNVIFSVDPGLLELVKASGEDIIQFTETCFEVFSGDYFADRGWGQTVEFSYVVHEKLDRLKRAQPHAHGTFPGTVPEQAMSNGYPTRRSIPYIDQTDLSRAQVIADRVVEQQLDLTLGREWRLNVSEYVHTYDESVPETVAKVTPTIPTIASEPVPPLRPELFSVDRDADLKKRLETIPEPPIELFPTLEFTFDDAAVATRLVEDLFHDEFVSPAVPIESPIGIDVEPSAADEMAVEIPATVPESPVINDELTPTVASPQSPLTVRLVPYWIPELGLGTIQVQTRWLDSATTQPYYAESYIYQTSVMEHLFFRQDGVIVADALLEAHLALDQQVSALNDALARDFEQGVVDLHQSWFETMALEGEATENGFLPGVPREWLPDDIDIPDPDWQRLPQVRWSHDSEAEMDYGLTVDVMAATDEGLFTLQYMRRVRDTDGIQQVEVVAYATDGESFPVGIQTLWRYGRQLEDDFADESRIAAQQAWREQFAPEVDEYDEFMPAVMDETEDYPDASRSASDERADEWDIDIDF